MQIEMLDKDTLVTSNFTCIKWRESNPQPKTMIEKSSKIKTPQIQSLYNKYKFSNMRVDREN